MTVSEYSIVSLDDNCPLRVKYLTMHIKNKAPTPITANYNFTKEKNSIFGMMNPNMLLLLLIHLIFIKLHNFSTFQPSHTIAWSHPTCRDQDRNNKVACTDHKCFRIKIITLLCRKVTKIVV